MSVIFILFSICKPLKNMKNASRYLNFYFCFSLVGHRWSKWWKIYFENTKFHVMGWFNFNQEIHFTSYFGKEKHSGMETSQHKRMLKECRKKSMQKICKINFLQALFYFLALSCKMWKQIIYDLTLLYPDNTPK